MPDQHRCDCSPGYTGANCGNGMSLVIDNKYGTKDCWCHGDFPVLEGKNLLNLHSRIYSKYMNYVTSLQLNTRLALIGHFKLYTFSPFKLICQYYTCLVFSCKKINLTLISIKFLPLISMLIQPLRSCEFKDMITQGEFSWYFNKFSPVLLQETYGDSTR